MKMMTKVLLICIVMIFLGTHLTGVVAETINQEPTESQDVSVNVEDLDFLPVGSVVRCKGSKQNVVIVARALLANDKNDQTVYFDYGAFYYPQGLVNQNVLYFQRDAIEEVVFVGYINDSEKQIVQQLLQFEEKNKDVPRGNVNSF